MRPGAIVRVRTRFDVQRRLSAQIPTVPLRAANARGRRPAEIDTAGASPTGRGSTRPAATPTCGFAAEVGRTAIKPSLLRHSCATVGPDRRRLSAPQQRLSINREPVDLQGDQAKLTPQRRASNPGSGIARPAGFVVRAVSARVLNRPLCVPDAARAHRRLATAAKKAREPIRQRVRRLTTPRYPSWRMAGPRGRLTATGLRGLAVGGWRWAPAAVYFSSSSRLSVVAAPCTTLRRNSY